jgi:hypothetical protein
MPTRTARTGRAHRVALVALSAVVADVAFDPVRRHLPLCPFHAVTGLQCPLCGGLRAVDELVHQHLATALRDNVLVVAAVPLVIVLWLLSRTGRPVRNVPAVAVVVLAVCFTVVRNLPFATALRPG